QHVVARARRKGDRQRGFRRRHRRARIVGGARRDFRHALAVEWIADVDRARFVDPVGTDQQAEAIDGVHPRGAWRRHRLPNPFTRPGWRSLSIVIAPFRLTPSPFFITNCTLRTASMFCSGSPSTAMMSAKKPALMGPR